MTDEELIAWVRNGFGNTTADRIEALVRERDRWKTDAKFWENRENEAIKRAERLEAAMREIESISVHSGGEVHGVTADHWKMAFEQAQNIARATLKGATHD